MNNPKTMIYKMVLNNSKKHLLHNLELSIVRKLIMNQTNYVSYNLELNL